MSLASLIAVFRPITPHVVATDVPDINSDVTDVDETDIMSDNEFDEIDNNINKMEALISKRLGVDLADDSLLASDDIDGLDDDPI